MFGNVREEADLERPEVQHIPHAILHGMEGNLDEWPQEGVEGAAAADDAVDQLRDEAAILRRDGYGGHRVVDEFGGERLAGARAVQHISCDLASGDRHDSTSGPKRMPSTMG